MCNNSTGCRGNRAILTVQLFPGSDYIFCIVTKMFADVVKVTLMLIIENIHIECFYFVTCLCSWSWLLFVL